MNRIVRIMLTNCHAAGIYWNFAGNNLFSKATVKIQNPHYKKISIINLQLTAWNNKIIVQHATRPEQNLLSCKNNLFKLGAWIPSYSNHLCVIYTYEQTKLPSHLPSPLFVIGVEANLLVHCGSSLPRLGRQDKEQHGSATIKEREPI